MRRLLIGCAVVIMLAMVGTVVAQSAPAFTKDRAVLKKWIRSPDNLLIFVKYVEDNAPSQEWLDNLEAVMFPEATTAEIADELSDFEREMQKLNLQKDTSSPEVIAFKQAYVAYRNKIEADLAAEEAAAEAARLAEEALMDPPVEP